MSDRWCRIHHIMSCFSSSPCFSLPIVLVQVHHSFICSNIVIYLCASSSRCVLMKSNLTFLLLSVFLLMKLIKASLHVDFHSGTPTSLKLFLTLLDAVEEVFLTMEIILSSCTFVVFFGLSGLLVLLSRSVHSFFLRIYQIFDLPTPVFCFLSQSLILILPHL